MPTPNIRRIRDGRTPLGRHPILSGELGASLARAEYDRAHEACRERGIELGNAGGELATVTGRIYEREREHRARLEALAVKTVAQAYGLSEESVAGLVAEGTLTDRGDLGTVGDDEGEAREADASADEGRPSAELRSLIARRRTHNAMIHGTGLVHMNKALVLAEAELEKVLPGIFEDYQVFVNLASLSQFFAPADALRNMRLPRAGRESVVWEPPSSGTRRNHVPDCRVWARAENFPVLVQELSKGVVEANMAHGLPKPGELSDEEAHRFSHDADSELHEVWYFMMGPALAERLQKALVERGEVAQYGDRPDFGVDMGYTRTLLAMLPERDLHERVRGLVGPSRT